MSVAQHAQTTRTRAHPEFPIGTVRKCPYRVTGHAIVHRIGRNRTMLDLLQSAVRPSPHGSHRILEKTMHAQLSVAATENDSDLSTFILGEPQLGSDPHHP